MRTLYHTIGGAQPPFVAAVLECRMVCRTMHSQVFTASMGALLGQSLLALELQHCACACWHIIRHASSTPLDGCQHGARCPAGWQCVQSRRAVCRAMWVSPGPLHPHHIKWHCLSVLLCVQVTSRQHSGPSAVARAEREQRDFVFAMLAQSYRLSLRTVFNGCAGSCCA
jgi:hypothetical protein